MRGKCTALTPLEVQTQVPKLNATAKGRLLFEEVVVGLRRTQPADPNTFIAIRNLDATIMKIGDIMVGLALQEEAAASALRELGPNHPCTQQLSEALTHMRQTVDFRLAPVLPEPWSAWPPSRSSTACMQLAYYVVGFGAGKGQYHVRHDGNERTGKPIGIKPENLVLYKGSTVIV